VFDLRSERSYRFHDMNHTDWNFAYYFIPVYFKGAAQVPRTTVFQRAMYRTKGPTLRLRPCVFVAREAFSKDSRLELSVSSQVSHVYMLDGAIGGQHAHYHLPWSIRQRHDFNAQAAFHLRQLLQRGKLLRHRLRL
jgi:hypothetical protein